MKLKKRKHANQPESDLPDELAQPARRALAGAGYQHLEQLTKISEDAIKHLHGVGPKAIEQLRQALSAQGLSFASGKREKE